MTFEELRDLDQRLHRVAPRVPGGIQVTPEHGRVLDELEGRPALTDVYEEQAYDMAGRAVYIRHKRDDLIGALERLDSDLASDIGRVSEIPLNVARALVYVKEYDTRWGDSDYSRAMIGEDVSDSLETIAAFRAEHQERMRNEAERTRRRFAADEACRRIRKRRAPGTRLIVGHTRQRARRRHVDRVGVASARPATGDPDSEPSTMHMFDIFETDVVAADGVWAVTFERQHGPASWGDVSFAWLARALHDDERCHVSWWAISGVLGAVLKSHGFDAEAMLEVFVSEYRRRFDRLLLEAETKNVIDQAEYTRIQKSSPKPIERIGREIERLCFFISGQLPGLRRFKVDGGAEMLLSLPQPEVYELESVALDNVDNATVSFYVEYSGLLDRALSPLEVERVDLDLRRVLRRGAFAARRIFVQPPPSPAAQPVPSPTAIDRAPPAVPGFTLLEQCGQGGFGTVHRAVDQANVVRAVKLLRPIYEDRDAADRFRREGVVLAKLRHPNVVGYVTLGENTSGWYLVMEFIDGNRLDDWARAQVDAERMRVILEVIDAIEYMHSCGVYHRDLKPSNILVRSNGSPVIVDLGMSWDDVGDETRTRSSIGASAYAPIESIDDPKHSRTPQHDVYSLGVLLYEVLVGQLPKRSSLRPMADVRDELSPFDSVVARALAPKDIRYPSPAKMAEGLREALAGGKSIWDEIFVAASEIERPPLRELITDAVTRGQGGDMSTIVTVAGLFDALHIAWTRRYRLARGSDGPPNEGYLPAIMSLGATSVFPNVRSLNSEPKLNEDKHGPAALAMLGFTLGELDVFRAAQNILEEVDRGRGNDAPPSVEVDEELVAAGLLALARKVAQLERTETAFVRDFAALVESETSRGQ